MITGFILTMILAVLIIFAIACVIGVITAAVGAVILLPFAIDIIMAVLLIKLIFGRKKKQEETAVE